MSEAVPRDGSEMFDGVVVPDIDQCPPLESRGGELQVTCIPPLLTQSHSGLTMAPIFPPRQERLDWQRIAELEPLVLVSGSPEEIGNHLVTPHSSL